MKFQFLMWIIWADIKKFLTHKHDIWKDFKGNLMKRKILMVHHMMVQEVVVHLLMMVLVVSSNVMMVIEDDIDDQTAQHKKYEKGPLS